MKMLSSDTSLGLKLLFECLTKPAFPKDRLEAKREIILGEIAANESEPQKRAVQEFRKLIYGEHPYGRPSRGRRDVIEKLTREDCIAFHKQLFVPNNCTVAIVGDFNSEQIVKEIEALTADWAMGDNSDVVTVVPAHQEKPLERIISDATASQTHVFLGHVGIRRNDPDYYKLEVMDHVLGTGSGFTDRLSSTLRDRQGLAYTVRANICDSASDQPGILTGYIGTFPDKYVWVRDGFMKEVRRIREEAATEQEVNSAKSYLLGILAFNLETRDQVAGELLAVEKYGLGNDVYDKYKAAIAAVTPADVLEVAKRHLQPDKMVIVAVGPIDEKGQPLKAPQKGPR
jgi:zinc protease